MLVMHRDISDSYVYSTSESADSDRTSVCVYLTGVPVGYYSDICTTKVLKPRCQTMFFFYFMCDRSLWNMHNYIHCMLCANLIAAQLMFVVGVERTENEVKSVIMPFLIIHSPAHRLSVQPLLCCSTTCSWWCSCGC